MSTWVPESQTVNFIPGVYYLRACSAASLAFWLEVKHEGDGAPFDLSGFTLEAPLTARGTDEPAPVPAWTLQVDDPPSGRIHVSLTSEQTVALQVGTAWPWVVWARKGELDAVLAHGDVAFSRA